MDKPKKSSNNILNISSSSSTTTNNNTLTDERKAHRVASNTLPTLDDDDFEKPKEIVVVEMDKNCIDDHSDEKKASSPQQVQEQQEYNTLNTSTTSNTFSHHYYQNKTITTTSNTMNTMNTTTTANKTSHNNFNKTMIQSEHVPHHQPSTLDVLSKALTPRNKNTTYQDNDLESQDHGDCLQMRTGIRISEIITSIGWLVCIGVYVFYLYSSIVGYLDAQANPSTSISYVEQVPLNYPAVTICNWNAGYYCDYCNLTLKTCTMVNDTDGTLYECPFELTTTVIEQNGQIFQCYVFNNDTNKPLTVKTTGYGGSISMYFTLPSTPSDRDIRYGLQASFHEIGTIPPVFAETNFAIPYVDNFFTLTKIETNRLKATSEHPLHSIRWDSHISNVQLTFKEESIVVVSFAYSTLNIHQVSEIAGKTILQLLGDLAGMLGVLLGIDILKGLRGVLEIPEAFQQKSFRPIYDLFN